MLFHNNKTPEQKLFKAINKLNARAVHELLSSGVDPNAQNSSGLTAFDFLIQGRVGSIVEYFNHNSYISELHGQHIPMTPREAKKIAPVWNELAKKGGTFNKYSKREVVTAQLFLGYFAGKNFITPPFKGL